jgi:hypothetical protein
MPSPRCVIDMVEVRAPGGSTAASAGFKYHFKGEVLDEIHVRLGVLDFAAELMRIRALNPAKRKIFEDHADRQAPKCPM